MTHMYFSARTEGLISYSHLGRTNSFFYRATLCAVFAVARCLSVCLSVHLSLCHVGVLYPDGWGYRRDFSLGPVAPIILFFTPCADTQFQGKPHQRGREIHRGWKSLRFSTEITVYLRNGTKWAHVVVSQIKAAFLRHRVYSGRWCGSWDIGS